MGAAVELIRLAAAVVRISRERGGGSKAVADTLRDARVLASQAAETRATFERIYGRFPGRER